MRFRNIAATAAATTMLIGLAACSSESPIASESSSGGGAKQITAVALMVQDISNPFFATMKTRMESVAQRDGFSIDVQDGGQDLGKQNDQIDAFIQKKVDLILLNAVDSQGIASAVKRATDAGVTVVAVDVDATGAQAVVMTNNIEAGTQSCTALADKIGGKGNIIIVDGTQITSVQDRVKGCEAVLAEKYPDIKVVGKQAGKNDVANGQTITTDLLTANPDLQGIFGINDPTARGAVLALKEANRTGIWVTGVDGSPEAVAEMKTAGSPFWATPAQAPADMVEKAYDLGKDIIAGNPPAERETLMEPTLVTQDNLSSYKGW
ncbi:MAG: substrate-binding domain-containing protein [Propionibacteriaceae bacterium]|jgi:ribose transport system substrate-binding protein|nr:substrate-binding domain-containing protein [Propionibacteriaceae bacterium]